MKHYDPIHEVSQAKRPGARSTSQSCHQDREENPASTRTRGPSLLRRRDGEGLELP